MHKIIALSGAQGQGKSTVLSSLKEEGEATVDLKTSRSILNDWGYTLTEVNGYIPLKIKFQNTLFNLHYTSLDSINQDYSGPVFVERSFADIFVYALVSVGPFNEYSNWLNEYYEKCKEAQRYHFYEVVYLTGREYTPEDDGTRSTNVHFSSMVDELIYKYTEMFANDESPFIALDSNDHKERVEILKDGADLYRSQKEYK